MHKIVPPCVYWVRWLLVCSHQSGTDNVRIALCSLQPGNLELLLPYWVFTGQVFTSQGGAVNEAGFRSFASTWAAGVVVAGVHAGCSTPYARPPSRPPSGAHSRW